MLTVVGSVAFDRVKTPFGERERMVGGSATHFSLAANFFTDVSVVGVVGEDFGAPELALFAERGIAIDDLERIPGGETFFWHGEYGYDLNSPTTIETRLNVFEGFKPKLSEASRAADILFLGNIQPDLQIEVRQQCSAGFAALDSMNLWIDIAKPALLEAITKVDAVLINDGELRELTGEPGMLKAAHQLLDRGPRAVVAKLGEYGAALYTADGFFALPAFPLEQILDPTGAGDSFAGGFLGYLDAHRNDPISDDLLRRAMTYGSVMASFNVEQFGTERVERLTLNEINERFLKFGGFTSFEPIAFEAAVPAT